MPKKSLNSLSIEFVVAGGEFINGDGELVAPIPQGSDRLTERPGLFVVTVLRSFSFHGLICGCCHPDNVECCHESFDSDVADIGSINSELQGSSLKIRKKEK